MHSIDQEYNTLGIESLAREDFRLFNYLDFQLRCEDRWPEYLIVP
jgi:hypothetical protein